MWDRNIFPRRVMALISGSVLAITLAGWPASAGGKRHYHKPYVFKIGHVTITHDRKR